jgi:hypothetical protein
LTRIPKSSSITKIDAGFDGTFEELDRRVRAALDPDMPSSIGCVPARSVVQRTDHVRVFYFCST